MKDMIEPVVAVIGAGPAGIFAARELAMNNIQVLVFNRDIKPGGLAEYGIYPDKYKMKEGLRKQFRQILAMPNIHYFGNALIGQNGDFTIEELKRLGFSAVLVTVGAQATKWLGLPGEDLKGVYHAKDIVYYYNRLPPFSQMDIQIGKRVAVVGAGNVMLDLARWLMNEKNVSEVFTIVRRGPAEVKFDRSQLEYIASNLNWQGLADEFKRVTPLMKAVGADPYDAFEFFRSACEKAVPALSSARLSFLFLTSPTRIMGDEKGNVRGLELEENTLVLESGQIVSRSTDKRRILDVDTILFAIGDRVDSRIGLPVAGYEFMKNPNPLYPIDGQSFEIFDPATGKAMDGFFMAGWARQASTGLVGVARKDGVQGAAAVLAYLGQRGNTGGKTTNQIIENLFQHKDTLVTKEDLSILESFERETAESMGLPEFKSASNPEMLKIMGRIEKAF